MKKLLCTLSIIAFASACATNKVPPTQPSVSGVVAHITENSIHGTVKEVWEEPMYDHIEVPGRLDPRGMYYRPPHKTVVEIRHGRYQRGQYPADKPVPQR